MCCRWRGRLWCGAIGMVSANQLSWFTQRSLSLSPAHRPRLNSGQLSCWSIVWPGRRMSQVISWVFTEVVPVISKHCSSCNILQRLRFLGSHHVVVTIWPLYSGQPTLYGWVYIWFCNTGHGLWHWPLWSLGKQVLLDCAILCFHAPSLSYRFSGRNAPMWHQLQALIGSTLWPLLCDLLQHVSPNH